MASDLLAGVESALEEMRPSLVSHGGDANLLKIEKGIVYLKLAGGCQGCPMSALTFGVFLKEMLQEKFPQEIKDVVWDEIYASDQNCH